MPTRSARIVAASPDGDESVTNEAPPRPGPKKAQEIPGAEGSAGKAARADADGSEAVEGHAMRARSPEAAAALRVPDTSKLRNIAEASYGPPPAVAESLIGVDNRVQISPTTAYPWRANASLLITAADNSQWIGTGWFVSPRTLVTAGHVVFIKGSGVPGRDGWVRRITVIPGRNAAAAPFGNAVSTVFRSVVGWTGSGNQEYDYGAIVIPTPLGHTVGWYGLGNYPDAQLVGQTANIAGYPGDKPSGTQWYHGGRITALGSRKVHYDTDTMGGQSGSAVYRIVGGNRIAVAVHAYGGASSNSGTRINGDVLARINGWKVA